MNHFKQVLRIKHSGGSGGRGAHVYPQQLVQQVRSVPVDKYDYATRLYRLQ